ncbi:MAG TPA: SET domain-containing protein-lysine N-methyltransferase [Ktedonobacteraceae bacterium]|nr:SET domain-containing protein-lysine N-methyltransferase [Ktedonobacteraceae bacterium]
MSQKIYRATSWYDARVEIRASAIQGGGMFARGPVQAGETVAIVGGTVMTEDEFHAYIATTERFNATQIGEHLHLVDLIQAPETMAGSINHSCDSNLWLQDEVTIVARRAIAPREEFTLDYALTTVEPQWQLDQLCQCGTAACRHTISGNDWQLPDVQQRYQGHFAPFINERILAQNPHF